MVTIYVTYELASLARRKHIVDLAVVSPTDFVDWFGSYVVTSNQLLIWQLKTCIGSESLRALAQFIQ